MDIHSGGKYPSNKLSNFAPNSFVVDDVECNSMEGFLQSLKFKNPEMQAHICTLVGKAAKKAGANKNWKKKQVLYWKGKEIHRDSQEYQELLDKAFDALAENASFQKALLQTGDATLTHSIGKRKTNETVLTAQEFVSRLMKIRERLKSKDDS